MTLPPLAVCCQLASRWEDQDRGAAGSPCDLSASQQTHLVLAVPVAAGRTARHFEVFDADDSVLVLVLFVFERGMTPTGRCRRRFIEIEDLATLDFKAAEAEGHRLSGESDYAKSGAE